MITSPTMQLPLDSYFPPAVRFTTCIALAVVTHLLVYIAISDLKLPHIEEKTVLPSVRLISLKASQSSQSSASSTPINESIIDTVGNSNFKTEFSEKEIQPQTAKKISRRQQTQPEDSPQTERQTRAKRSLEQLFSQSRSNINTPQSAKQVATKDAPLLTEYELTLLNHMSGASLYDDITLTLEQKNQNTASYDIQIILFSHGAIRSAKIRRSSGIPEIDTLAITAAYNASPFPRPPASDQSKGFSYRIPVEYNKP